MGIQQLRTTSREGRDRAREARGALRRAPGREPGAPTMTTTAEWVETNCNPLPNDNGFVAMPSTLKDSARFDAALSFLQKMFGWIMDEEHPTDSEVQEELEMPSWK